jgi:hypothetical protein
MGSVIGGVGTHDRKSQRIPGGALRTRPRIPILTLIYFYPSNATRRHPPKPEPHAPPSLTTIPRTAPPIALPEWRNCAALRVGRRAIAGGGWFPFPAPNRRVRLAAWEPCLDQRALPDEANRAAAKDGELWREDG